MNGSGRRWRGLALALALTVLLAATACTGCGGSNKVVLSHAHVVELARERADLAIASSDLERLETPLQIETVSAAVAWANVCEGLPTEVTPAMTAAFAAAAKRAQAIVTPPRFQPHADALTGPASGIASIYNSFLVLGVHGWRLLEQTVVGAQDSSEAISDYFRDNAGLYIDAVYNGQFDLGVIGKSLQHSYLKLGGPAAFGTALTESRIAALASFYSPTMFRLEPHPSTKSSL